MGTIENRILTVCGSLRQVDVDDQYTRMIRAVSALLLLLWCGLWLCAISPGWLLVVRLGLFGRHERGCRMMGPRHLATDGVSAEERGLCVLLVMSHV